MVKVQVNSANYWDALICWESPRTCWYCPITGWEIHASVDMAAIDCSDECFVSNIGTQLFYHMRDWFGTKRYSLPASCQNSQSCESFMFVPDNKSTWNGYRHGLGFCGMVTKHAWLSFGRDSSHWPWCIVQGCCELQCRFTSTRSTIANNEKQLSHYILKLSKKTSGKYVHKKTVCFQNSFSAQSRRGSLLLSTAHTRLERKMTLGSLHLIQSSLFVNDMAFHRMLLLCFISCYNRRQLLILLRRENIMTTNFVPLSCSWKGSVFLKIHLSTVVSYEAVTETGCHTQRWHPLSVNVHLPNYFEGRWHLSE